MTNEITSLTLSFPLNSTIASRLTADWQFGYTNKILSA
jgi:hypothetical protein